MQPMKCATCGSLNFKESISGICKQWSFVFNHETKSYTLKDVDSETFGDEELFCENGHALDTDENLDTHRQLVDNKLLPFI